MNTKIYDKTNSNQLLELYDKLLDQFDEELFIDFWNMTKDFTLVWVDYVYSVEEVFSDTFFNEKFRQSMVKDFYLSSFSRRSELIWILFDDIIHNKDIQREIISENIYINSKIDSKDFGFKLLLLWYMDITFFLKNFSKLEFSWEQPELPAKYYELWKAYIEYFQKLWINEKVIMDDFSDTTSYFKDLWNNYYEYYRNINSDFFKF